MGRRRLAAAIISSYFTLAFHCPPNFASGATAGLPSSAKRNLTINHWTMDYLASSVKEFHARLNGGDLLAADGSVTQNLHVYSRDGHDQIFAAAGNHWLIGWTGDNTIDVGACTA